MSDLTEKWKNGELESGWYFVKLYDRLNIVWLEYTQQDGFFGYYGNHITDYEVEQILAPVPSYAEWQSLNELVDCMSDTGKAFAHMLSPFTDDYFNGLTTKDIAELAKKSIRLTTQHCEDNAEIDKLKELLKEYKKQLSEIKIAYINLTTQDEYGSYYIDEAKLFVEIVGKIIKNFKTENEE